MRATDRGPMIDESKRALGASHLVLWLSVLVGSVVVALTYRDYGPTWDEGVQARYGELALDYFRSGGEDRACNEYLDLRYYGPLVEMVPALMAGDTSQDEIPVRVYELRHLFLALLSVASLPALWWLGRRFRRVGVGAFAVLGLITLPRFYAHLFNNAKDASFALAMIWFMASLAYLFRGPRLTWRGIGVAGVAMGLGLCARPGGLPLFLLFTGCGLLLWLVTRPADELGERPGLRPTLRDVLPKLAAGLALAWTLMVLPWPWAHERVLAHPFEAIRLASAFPTTVTVLFDGQVITSDRLPWDYLTRYLLITTPLPVLVLAAAGLGFGLRDQLAHWRSREAWLMGLTQVWLFAPLALFVVVRPNIHGGVRHFLFVLPALVLLAANGAAGLMACLRAPRARQVLGVGLGVALLLPVRDLVRLHPYQVAYYNALVGGTTGAEGRDWTDYYLSSYAEAVRWVDEQAQQREQPVRALITAGPSVLLWARAYASDDVQLDSVHSLPERPERLEADYFITSTRFGTGLFPDAPVVHSIGRAGAVFTVIKGRWAAQPGEGEDAR